MRGLLRFLLELESALDRIQEKVAITMATLKTFQDLLTAINTETDRLAAKIQALIDQVQNSSLTGAEETELLNGLQAVKDRLTVVGADPANPIPAVK